MTAIPYPTDFGGALTLLRAGQRMARTGWNGAGQYVVLQAGYPDGIAINGNTARATGLAEGTMCVFDPYLMLCNAAGHFVPWQPSVGDVLARDWIPAGA